MSQDHPSAESLERFLCGAATLEECRHIVRHLLSGCERCLRVTRTAWHRAPGDPPRGAKREDAGPRVHPASYRGLWGRLLDSRRDLEARLEEDRQRAQLLFRELTDLPARERLAALRGDVRFTSFELCKRLMEESRRRCREDPVAAEEWAELAVAGVERLDREVFTEAAVSDLEGAARIRLAASRRRRGDLPGAEQALELAGTVLENGSGDPLERAELLLQKASLRREQNRLEDARSLLRRARSISERLGEEDGQGRALLERARVEARAGDPRSAAESARQGLEKLEPGRHPAAALEALLDLGHRCLDGGLPHEAARVLSWARRSGPPEAPPQLRWEMARLAGRLEGAHQRRESAEALLDEARRGFVEAGLARQAALATFDLAALFLSRDEKGKLRHLGEILTPVLLTRGAGIDETAALMLLREATESERATPGLVAHLASHLSRIPPTPW